MAKRRVNLLVGLCCALVLAALPAAASAQSCTTLALSSWYSTTTCSDGSSSTTTCIGKSYCTTDVSPAPQQPVYVPPPPPVYVYVPAPALPPPPADQGITINLDSGGQTYLARATFVKIGDAQAIYWVYGGQLHSFTTWPQFLNAGGKPDLSNVTRFAALRDSTGGLFGQPVQN